MPVRPYTWAQYDFLTASRLNSELYRTVGEYFQPNGIGFHAARPVYKAYFNVAGGYDLSEGNIWSSMAEPGTPFPGQYWYVVADTAGYFGCRGDQDNIGMFGLGTLQNGGGELIDGDQVVYYNAGLGLVFGNLSFVPSTGILRAGLGAPTGTTPSATGTMAGLNADADTGQWVLDIQDTNVSTTATAISLMTASTSGVTNVANEPDGSNQCNRLHAVWASAYPYAGTQVTALPTPAASWSATSPTLGYQYMNGTAGIGQVMNLLNMPPLLRATGNGSHTTVANNSTATCVYNSVTYDTYGAYNDSTYTYTVPLNGLYLVYNCFPFDNIGTTSTTCGVSINSTSYWGPTCATVNGQGGAASKVQIFSLHAGDTIAPIVYQNSGSSHTGSTTYNGRLIVLFLGMEGAPGTLPSVPDITYSWVAGTPASSMPTLMNEHFANDLLFLTQRPYFMGYQGTAQTGIPMGASTLTIGTTGGIVHGDAGDNYSGWASNTYTSQRNGYYLAVQETYMATPSLTATPYVMAGFSVTPGGDYGSDFYQSTNQYAGNGNGAAAVGLYYLRAGDTIIPRLYTNFSSNTTTSTYAASGYNSHFELMWLGQ